MTSDDHPCPRARDTTESPSAKGRRRRRSTKCGAAQPPRCSRLFAVLVGSHQGAVMGKRTRRPARPSRCACMHADCPPHLQADCPPHLQADCPPHLQVACMLTTIPRADGRVSDAFSDRELQATGSSKALDPAASAAPRRNGRRLRRKRFRQPRCPIWAAAATAGRHGDGHHRGRWCPWHLEPEIRARAIAVRTCPPQDLAVARRPGQPRA